MENLLNKSSLWVCVMIASTLCSSLLGSAFHARQTLTWPQIWPASLWHNLWSNVGRVASLKSHSLCQHFKSGTQWRLRVGIELPGQLNKKSYPKCPMMKDGRYFWNIRCQKRKIVGFIGSSSKITESQNWLKSPAWYHGAQVDWLLPPTNFHTSLDKNIEEDAQKIALPVILAGGGLRKIRRHRREGRRRSKMGR